jgi:presequence protease
MLQIRERRGAYGAWATMDRWTGVLLFMSYRDPNLGETLQVYAYVPSYLKEEMENAATAVSLINSAIIGTIGSLDGSAPQPNSAGWLSLIQYLSGSNAEIRQKWREEILATNYKAWVRGKPHCQLPAPRQC